MPETIASLVTSDGKVARTFTGSSLPEAVEGLNIEPDPNTWVWLNYSNSTPDDNALETLVATAERASELTAIIGPKVVSKTNPRIITQLGLTLTPLGDAFSPVSNVFDQGQKDRPGDVLAVGAAGMFVRSTVFSEVGSFDSNAPELASDIDFSIRTRMAGYRVVVQPKAKVAYEGKAADLGKAMKVELRKASIHLRMVYSPIWLVAFYTLALIPLGFIRAIYRLAQKRPDRIWAEIYSAFWGVFTLPKRLASRKLLPTNPKATLAGMKPLRASWSEVRQAARANADIQEAEQNLAAFEKAEESEVPAKTFGQALSWLIVGLLLVVSWQVFPISQAISGTNIAPLSPNLADLFARAGASWQPIGNGFAAPSDPFNWVLLLLGTLTFWAPQFSIGLLLFLARALAFAGAWRVVGLFTKKAWVKNSVALAFALWPALSNAIADAQLADLVATVTLPWLVLSIARAAGVGRIGSARSNSQTWSWVALSGLLIAIEGASSPILLPLILLGLAVVAFMRIKRFGYLFWIPLPLGAILMPYAYYLAVVAGSPGAILASPGLGNSRTGLSNLELLTGGSVLAIGLLLVALLALLAKRWVLALALWGVLVTLLAAAWLTQNLWFAGAGTELVAGSPNALLGAVALIFCVLAALALDSLNVGKASRFSALAVSIAVIAPLTYLGVTQSPNFSQTDGRVVPWLLYSQAESDSQMLVISAEGSGYAVNWVPVRGIHLEDANNAYMVSLAKLQKTEEFKSIAKLAADMISANGVEITEQLNSHRIQYVLVPNDKTAKSLDIGSALDSVPELESAGVTDFGRLWRVKGTSKVPPTEHSIWSITKSIQVGILAAFVLLAIPSRGSRRSNGDSEIFVDGDESDV